MASTVVKKVRFAVAPSGVRTGSNDFQVLVDALESSRFDGIWLSDVPLSPSVDPILGLSFAASRTRRLKLGANVVPFGRSPFVLAKELAQLDQLSNGRLLLAFVPGLNQRGERDALGTVGVNRGVMLEGVLDLVRRWWNGESITRESEHWKLHDIEPAERPLQDPLEVWLGGRGPKALDRVGRVADGWLGAAVTPHEAAAARQTIERSAAVANRAIDPEHFGMSIAYARKSLDPAMAAGLQKQRPDLDPSELVPTGQESLRELVDAYRTVGISKFVLRPVRIEAPWDQELEWLAEAVLDLQT